MRIRIVLLELEKALLTTDAVNVLVIILSYIITFYLTEKLIQI